MASVISIRVSDEEKKVLENFSQLYGRPVSTMMKDFTLEHLEDEFDLKIIEDYEKDVASGKESVTSWADFKRELHGSL